MLLTYVAFHDFQLPPRRRLICHSRFLKFITLLLPSGSHLSTLAHSTRKTEASEKSDRIVARHTHVCKFHWHLKSFMRSKSRVQLDPGHYDWSILTCLAWCWHMSRFSKHLWRFLGTTEWCFSVEPDHSMATRELFHWKETYGSSVSTMPGHSVKLNGYHREEDHVSMSVHSAKFPSITLRMIEITEIGISIHCSHLRTFRDDVWAIFVWQRNLIYANWRSLENYGHGSFTAVHFRVRRVIGAVGSKNWSFRPPGPPLLGHWTSGPSGSKYYIFLFIYF